jgi:sulfoxide reductase heme-binding subunit YedZ
MSAGPHLFWITSRAAGVAAMMLASVSVTVGLVMSSRRTGRRIELRALHETLSLATLAAVALHGASLLFDGWLRPGVVGIAIPFAGAYRPLWTGIGIVSGYGLAVLGLSYYARHRIGQARWRTLHQLTALFWALAALHSVKAGTDARQVWFLAALALPALPAAVLIAVRAGGGLVTALEPPGAVAEYRPGLRDFPDPGSGGPPM